MLKLGKTTHRRDIPMATTDELLDILMKNYKKPEVRIPDESDRDSGGMPTAVPI